LLLLLLPFCQHKHILVTELIQPLICFLYHFLYLSRIWVGLGRWTSPRQSRRHVGSDSPPLSPPCLFGLLWFFPPFFSFLFLFENPWVMFFFSSLFSKIFLFQNLIPKSRKSFFFKKNDKLIWDLIKNVQDFCLAKYFLFIFFSFYRIEKMILLMICLAELKMKKIKIKKNQWNKTKKISNNKTRNKQ